MKKNHKAIPPNTLNAELEYCIDQYVRKPEERQMLRDWWFGDYTIEGLAKKYFISTTSVKKILYKKGDPVLIAAVKRSSNE